MSHTHHSPDHPTDRSTDRPTGPTGSAGPTGPTGPSGPAGPTEPVGLVSATRDALGDLADRARPVNLADRAVAGARRRHRYALAGGVAVAAAVAAVVVLGGLLLAPAHRPGGTTEPGASGAASGRPTGGPVTVTPPTPGATGTSLGQTEVRPPAKLVTAAGFDVAAWSSQGTPAVPSVVYDRAHHRYVQVHYSGAVPAPTGTLVVVTSQDYPYPVSLLDTATGATTKLDIEGYEPGDAQWSPDGSKLLFRVSDKGGRGTPYGFAVVDVATRQSHTVWVHQSQYDSSDGQFNWYPGGTKVALSIADRAHSSEATGDAVLHLQLFDLAGRPAGTVPVKAPAPAAHAWSPDRRYLVGVNADPAVALGAVVLVDTRTGRVVAKLPDVEDAWWLDATHLVARVTTYDRAHAEVDSLDELDVSTLPGGGTARYSRSTPLPAVSGDSPGLVLYPHRG